MKDINSLDDLKNFAEVVKKVNFYKEPIAWAIGRVDKGIIDSSKTLCVNYANVNYKDNSVCARLIMWALQESGIKIDFSNSEFVANINLKVVKNFLKVFKNLKAEMEKLPHNNYESFLAIREILENDEEGENHFCLTFIFEDKEPKSVESVYLKLYLLSLAKVPLRSINLNGAFRILPNVAWDENSKPIEIKWLKENEIFLKINGIYPTISSVDKFPRYLSHIVPDEHTRILDSAKVRMGAQLASGTTVMPGASYVNFNAGTTGSVMIEGRVSSSVVVGEGSDIGGGASILGVLSGTNGNPVSIGKRCLLGANSVTGISLGNDCIIDGGIAILEGTKVFVSEKSKKSLQKINANFNFEKEIYKASELSNLNGLHFRQNSQTGQITVSISQRAIKLNCDLH